MSLIGFSTRSRVGVVEVAPVSAPAVEVGADWERAVEALPAWARVHPAEVYVSDVLAGRVVACRWVRLACERHRRDLLEGQARGLVFRPKAGRHVLDFFRFLRHSKGEWAGSVVRLEPWEQAILWILFGWFRADGTRRFRTAYLEVARKNGKSTLAAGVGLYLLIGDREPGAEVYAAATKRAQAKLVFDEATRMVKRSPSLRRRIRCFRDNLHIEGSASKMEPLGRDADTMDGLNVHGAVIDELHAHKTDDVWGVLETATGSRRQPLIFGITTAGFYRDGFCFRLREYLLKVLDGVVCDDAFFGMVFTLDEGDDWADEGNWVKANPNLGVSVKLSDLRDKAQRAASIGSALTHFLTKHLNVWTNAAELWIHPERWRACGEAFDEGALAGRACYAGLDLSNTLDLTAWVLVFPPLDDDPRFVVLPRFWVPEDAIEERRRNERVPYDQWVREGWITAIPGAVIDYEWIFAQIDRDAQMFDVREVGYDRWGAAQVYLRLEKAGLTTVQIGQGFQSMSAPMKELEKLVASRGIRHGDHPVLTWNMHNLVASVDPAGNLKPDKRRSREKIDGAVALVMGLDRATRHDAAAGGSMYDDPAVVEVFRDRDAGGVDAD